MANIENASQPENEAPEEEKSFFKIIVHSFFIVPFLIAVFCVLLFAGIHLLTSEQRSAYDYLEDVKTGGTTKRWQGAFELSRLLSNPGLIPDEERFAQELINAFEKSKGDDPRTRQYLALAMGRTGRKVFMKPMTDGLSEEREGNLPALIFGLGMLGQKESAAYLYPYAEHQDSRIRSIAVAALGTIANPDAKGVLIRHLNDPEPNVQWGAAVSLAQMNDAAGKEMLVRMLDRKYWSTFPQVSLDEQNNLMLTALQAAAVLNDTDLNSRILAVLKSDPNLKVRAAAEMALHK